MARYLIKGINDKGEFVRLKLHFTDEGELNHFLKSKKIVPVNIKEEKRLLSFFINKISDIDISISLFQLGMLLKRGVPLNNAIDILYSQTTNESLKRIFKLLKKDVEQGVALSKGMEKAGIFPHYISEMVKVGEVSGNLDDVLISASKYIENRNELKNRFTNALIYPSIVLLVGILAIIIVAIFVTPKITSIYTNFGKQLPLELKVVSAISSGILLVIKLSPLLILFFYYIYRKYLKGKVLYFLFNRLPFVKEIYDYVSLNAFSQVVYMLLIGGVSLEKSFRMGAEVIKNSRFYEPLKMVSERLILGEKLKNALEKESVFPEEFVKLLSSGDEVGDVSKMSLLVSEVYGKMANRKISILLSYLEPMIVIFLAIFVGAFIMATLLPIINLSVK